MRVWKKILIFAIILPNIIYGFAPAEESDKHMKIALLPGSIELGEGADSVGEYRVEAALRLCGRISGRYFVLPLSTRDSIAREFFKSGEKPTLSKIARRAGADTVVFVRVSRLKNMLRADLVFAGLDDSAASSSGFGYAPVRYFYEDTLRVLDPALLKAIQRAFATCAGDSNMFADSPGKFRTFPANTLVVGGLQFLDDENLDPWDLFQDKIVNAYDAAESMFKQAVKSDRYAVYDLDSRDAIYAKFDMRIVENDKAPTRYEARALYNFEVDEYLTGIIERTERGGELKLIRCAVRENYFEVIDSARTLVRTDDVIELRKGVKDLVGKLYKIEEE